MTQVYICTKTTIIILFYSMLYLCINHCVFILTVFCRKREKERGGIVLFEKRKNVVLKLEFRLIIV